MPKGGLIIIAAFRQNPVFTSSGCHGSRAGRPHSSGVSGTTRNTSRITLRRNVDTSPTSIAVRRRYSAAQRPVQTRTGIPTGVVETRDHTRVRPTNSSSPGVIRKTSFAQSARQYSTPICALMPDRNGCFSNSISVARSAISISSSLAFRPVQTTCVISGFSSRRKATTSATSI